MSLELFRCEADIQKQMTYLQNRLKEDERFILQQLDSLVEEELSKALDEIPRELKFQPNMPESVLKLNLLGVLVKDGVLASHLSLHPLSQLEDYRAGATLSLEVAGPGDSWQRRIVVTVLTVGEDGNERKLPVQRETNDGKVLVMFEAGLGVHRVSVTLHGQHIQSSPFLIPIRGDPEKILAEVGLCFQIRNFIPGQIVLVNREHKAVIKEIMNPTSHYLVQFVEKGNLGLISSAEVSHPEDEPPRPQQKAIQTRQDCEGEGGGGNKKEVCSSNSEGFELVEKRAAPPTLPRGLQCSLCMEDARKPQELICDGSIVCWNCAVKVSLHYYNQLSLQISSSGGGQEAHLLAVFRHTYQHHQSPPSDEGRPEEASHQGLHRRVKIQTPHSKGGVTRNEPTCFGSS